MKKRSGEKILILDRGNVEFAFPGDWSVKPDKAGFIKLEDAGENCLLEVSYMRLPPLGPGAPDVAERVRAALGQRSTGAHVQPQDRGDLRFAWSDYAYASDDPGRGIVNRPARGRLLIAENGLHQALMTFYYWADDAAWAVPAWERIVATLRLGFGEQLSGPQAHWALREPGE
ncbi:MAG: hypothetical protein K8T20_17970 [Planctomycetes bacterium]|nr:hypothetical protein [Planctomycetota bacterium]